ncbi:MAG TPA: DUF4097 family beta strand repeat-containing protein [Pyrinomonadaceae bacterium]
MLIHRKSFYCLLLFLYLLGMPGTGAVGQDKKPPKDPPARERVPKPGPHPPGFIEHDSVTWERSMMVDPNVAIKLCVAEGDLKINGWQREEVRIFVKNGRKFEMKPLEKSAETGKVNWLWVAHVTSGRPRPASECLAGDTIEIDAPVGTAFDLSGRAARTSVDSVKKVKVKILEGVIMLRNIAGGINAYTSQGDVMVDNSAGAIQLESTTGNIVAIDVKPGQIGELLRAKTNSGAITLQRVSHRQIEASSISGSLLFDGQFLTGGIYNFRTSNGSIRLAIPTSSSCTFKMTYGFGSFNSEIPLKILTVDENPRVKTVVASLGTGSAAVSLTTSSGSIGIRKTGGKL